MLAGLTPIELGRLRMSVGYGGHKKGRLLSPIEVGLYFRRAYEAGEDSHACASASGLDKSGVIKFLKIAELPRDLQHMVDWGAPRDAIGFTAALELTRLENASDQSVVAEAILSNKFTSKEIRQIAQLRNRSGRLVEECIDEVLGMRPSIERCFVFIGIIDDKETEKHLSRLTQTKRNVIIENSIRKLNLSEVNGRLGTRLFTLVGGDKFNESMEAIGKEKIEIELRKYISKAISDVEPNSFDSDG